MSPLVMAMRTGVMPATAYRDTGALQRSSPLPRGSYWLDTFQRNGSDTRALFAAWIASNAASVKLISREDYDSEDPPRTWWLFKVTGGASGTNLPAWDARTFGFPTIAEPGVTTSDDTVQKPTVEDLGWSGIFGLSDLPSIPWGYIALGAAGVGVGLIVLNRSISK